MKAALILLQLLTKKGNPDLFIRFIKKRLRNGKLIFTFWGAIVSGLGTMKW